uniref:Uncharacterized protein n=1 Tax=Anguilla anguilla TaxID=7936 RepID=A0A0E9VRQ6_ANGAN
MNFEQDAQFNQCGLIIPKP